MDINLLKKEQKSGKLNYKAINYDIIPFIPLEAEYILDIGCGTGDLAKYLNGKYVIDGITYSIEEANIAQPFQRNTYNLDLNKFSLKEIEYKNYDCIICSHILEHLYEPWQLVKKLEGLLNANGVIIIAVPNMMFYMERLDLLKGKFDYSLSGGPMDITHYRFFSWYSANILFNGSNLKLLNKTGSGIIPLGFLRKINRKIFLKIEKYMINKFPNLFNFQIILVLQKA